MGISFRVRNLFYLSICQIYSDSCLGFAYNPNRSSTQYIFVQSGKRGKTDQKISTIVTRVEVRRTSFEFLAVYNEGSPDRPSKSFGLTRYD